MTLNIDFVIAALSTPAAVAAIRYAYKVWKAKQEKAFPLVLEKIVLLYSLLNTMVSSTDISRAVILRVENGGKIPDTGKNLYCSVVYETFSSPLTSVKYSWQRQILDEQFVFTLYQLDQAGHLYVDTAKLSPGILTDYYIGKVAFSHLIKVYVDDGVFYILALDFVEHPGELDAAYRDTVRASASRIGHILKETHVSGS